MSEVCIRVAVRIRPLLAKEVLHHHQVCVRVVPGSTQVMLGSDRVFSFDHAFGPTASQDEVYDSCVQPLVKSLIHGHNATVFCYGQTGSGKTYTLGGGSQDEEGGIIDRVAQDVFLLLADKTKNNNSMETTVRVSYMEVYKEELRDLLEFQAMHKELHIREDDRGNTVVVGAKEMDVSSAEELLGVLEIGNALRHTGTTGMNEHSSRSHAILTLQLICCHSNNNFPSKSKLCLVDLAGSERAGKTASTGTQLKECAHINTGLLALSNVIRALSDNSRNRHGSSSSRAHIPYRDAKITRLLRDSLGGTAHTLMVACVSPSHHSVAETLNVLQFASKARHIRNRPGVVSAQTDVKLCLTTWHPSEARLGELEYEVQTLRELLKDKAKDIETEKEKAEVGGGKGEHLIQSSQVKMSEPNLKVNQQEVWKYCILLEEAATLLADVSDLSPSVSFKQQLEEWQERLTAISRSQQSDDLDCSEGHRDQPYYGHILKLQKELHKCQESLCLKEQLLEQKDAELRQVKTEVEKLLLEQRTHLTALEEEKKRIQTQTEQLVKQQVLIDRLRSNFIGSRETTVEATADTRVSGYFDKRSHSVPLITSSCVHRPSRKIHSSPPTYSLEKIMAAFKMRGHLLLAEIEENEDVYCPFIKQKAETRDRDQENKEEDMDSLMGRTGSRHSLNQTWTCQQENSALKEQSRGLHGKTIVQSPQQTTDAVKSQHRPSRWRNARRAGSTERRIHDLSVNMQMKEELIKELDKTDEETLAVNRHSKCNSRSGETDVLLRLSMQSQQVRAEVYNSLQHMKQQKAELQGSLKLQRETGNSNKELRYSLEQSAASSAACRGFSQEESNTRLHDSSWLEKEEEKVLQKRGELQWLEEELKRREEVILNREVYLQRKNKLEIKKLRSSKAVNQELLRVSMELKSVEAKLQSSKSVRDTGAVTIEEMEKKRDMLKIRRDNLDVQLRNSRALTDEEEHFLLQLVETIEALDAALEFRNHFIQEKKKHLLVTETSLHLSQSAEPAWHCDVIRRLQELSPPETLKLLVKYFNKVICLREAEQSLRLRCEELEIHVEEQEAVLKEMEASIHLLALYADRRLTQQHRDHQNNIQLLLQNIKEGVLGETQQGKQDRLQHLEKELFFYKTSTRQLKKKLKELLSEAIHPDNQPLHTEEHEEMHDEQIKGSANESQPNSGEAPTQTRITTTYTKIYSEQTHTLTQQDSSANRLSHQARVSSLSSECQVHKKTKMSGCRLTQMHRSGIRGQSGESLEKTPVQVCRRELRQISPADLQVSGSFTKTQQPFDTITESMIEDSIETKDT